MTTLITLTTAGTDTGPFDLYSNLDGYVLPFATGISKAVLQAGYLATVPDYTNIVRVKSKGICINYVDITLSTISYPYTLQTGVDCPTACTAGSAVIFM